MLGDYFGMWRKEGANRGNWTSGAEPPARPDHGLDQGTLLRHWTRGFFQATSSQGKTTGAVRSPGRNVVIRRQCVPDLDRQTRALRFLLEQLSGPAPPHATESDTRLAPSPCLVSEECSAQREGG